MYVCGGGVEGPTIDLVVRTARQVGITVKPDIYMVALRDVVHQGAQYQHLSGATGMTERHVTTREHASFALPTRFRTPRHPSSFERHRSWGGGETQLFALETADLIRLRL